MLPLIRLLPSMSPRQTWQKRNMKKHEIKDLKDSWGTDEEVLNVLRQLIQMVSHLSFAVRAPSFTDAELRQLDLLARDAVRSIPLWAGWFLYLRSARVGHTMVVVVSQAHPTSGSFFFFFFYDDDTDFSSPKNTSVPHDTNWHSPSQVGVFSGVLGRTGSRPTIHSILHTAEAVRRHGESEQWLLDFNLRCGLVY